MSGDHVHIHTDASNDTIVTAGLLYASQPWTRASLGTRRALRHKRREMALERLAYAIAPAVRDGLRRRIGEDILFASPVHRRCPAQRINGQNSPSARKVACSRLGRRLRYVEAAVHLGVDGVTPTARKPCRHWSQFRPAERRWVHPRAAFCAAFITVFFIRFSPAQYKLISWPSGSLR